MQRIQKLILCTVLAIMVSTAISQPKAGEREQDALRGVLNKETINEQMFAPSFLAQLSFKQIQAITSKILSSIGTPTKILERGKDYLVETRTHEMPITIALSENGKIIRLFFRPAILTGQNNTVILEKINRLGGDIAYLVIRDDKILHQQNANEKLAVGSAFKLGILAALAEKIEGGEARWDDVVRLKAGQISLPTGMLQKMPLDSPFTLHTLASFMISISDNTATDILLDFVGRKAVAVKLGVDFVLKTREFFTLKADAKLRKRFLAGDNEAKIKLAAEIAKLPQPDIGKVSAHHNKGVEFYVPLTRLCALITEVSALDVMSINPGLADPEDWQHVAFKGGSEQGVLNFTTQVTGKNGTNICVAFTWNAKHTLDLTKAGSLVSALIKNLR